MLSMSIRAKGSTSFLGGLPSASLAFREDGSYTLSSGLHPCDHSTAKVNISQPMLYTTAKSEQGDARCEADHTVESLN